MPGPRAPTMRPRRNTTARSYSFRILTPLMRTAMTIIKNVKGTPNPNITPLPQTLRTTLRGALDLEHHSIDTHPFDSIAGFNFTVGLGFPILAVNEHAASRLKFFAHDADLTHQTFYTQSRFRFLRAKDQIADGKNERTQGSNGRKHNRSIDAEIRSRRIEKEQRAERERNDAADS